MVDFNKYIDRTKMGSMKWSFPTRYLTPAQVAANPLPLWVADMDFQAPIEVIEALQQSVAHDIFGYSLPRDSFFEAVCGWQEKRFGWKTKPEWIVQTPGVVTSLNLAIQAFTKPGESVIIQTPVYVHFHKDVLTNDRRVISVALDYKDNQYYFDAAKFEAAIEKDTKLFILCNPHNPTGNVWSLDDLTKMAEICKKHNILVVSDEIHEDLIFDSNVKHIPFAKLGEDIANNCIVCTAPSKTFNLAGLQVSNIFIPNAKIKEQFVAQAVKNGTTLVNCLGLIACEAAYAKGESWLNSVLEHIRSNYQYLEQTLQKDLPQLKLTATQALYLAWIDFSALNMDPQELVDFLIIKAGVWFDDGRKFGNEGHGFMRINLGCTRGVLEEAMNRLKKAING